VEALLVVDVQNELMKKKIYNRDVFISTINQAIKIFRESEKVIIFIQHINKFLVENSMGWRISEELSSNSKDIFFAKKTGNGFENPKLLAFLHERKIDTITVCGLVTHGCVKATCLGGMNKGFKVKLIKNGHSLWNKDAKEKILCTENELTGNGVEVVVIR